jgi:NAD(P)-dependent dehydrogenase (short-subunit alcohol dehydrogenase family)
MDLKGRAAFVTGGSGDIGGAIARALAAAGADVAISYLGHPDEASATVDALQAMGRRSLAVQLDQRDSRAIDTCIDSVVGELGRLDILVNNAAVFLRTPLAETTAGQWDRILGVNLRGAFFCAQAAVRLCPVAGAS